LQCNLIGDYDEEFRSSPTPLTYSIQASTSQLHQFTLGFTFRPLTHTASDEMVQPHGARIAGIGGSRVSVPLEIAGFSRTQFAGHMNQPDDSEFLVNTVSRRT
jgi:hypothetical protein